MTMKTKKRKPERVLLRVIKGGFTPADGYTAIRLREKGFNIGDVVLATLTKPRNPKFHRMMHQFGKLLADNIDDFDGMNAHDVLKRIQYESGLECEQLGVKLPGVGFVEIRQARSLSFASMGEGEFAELYRGLARHVAAEYWPDLTDDQIEQMVNVMPDEK